MIKNMNKGVLLITLISSETLINPNFLMEDEQFVKEVKSLIKQKINFFDIKKKMVKWCQKNY
jgi:hypothetical protein